MYVYFGPETRQQTYGVAVLSRFPLYNTETYSLTSVGEQVVLLRADIQWKGEPVSVYVTHLGETEEDRSTQTAEILEILSVNTNPKILIGDFNSLPDSEQMKAFTKVVDDAWVTAGNPLLDPLGNTSSALAPATRIDYIMVSPVFTVRTCEVIWGVYGSDHLPVWAEVVWVEARNTVYHAIPSQKTISNRLQM
jgi:endonuclease/exonuclease/phosphatase family metal-dependent hydrolase